MSVHIAWITFLYAATNFHLENWFKFYTILVI